MELTLSRRDMNHSKNFALPKLLAVRQTVTQIAFVKSVVHQNSLEEFGRALESCEKLDSLCFIDCSSAFIAEVAFYAHKVYRWEFSSSFVTFVPKQCRYLRISNHSCFPTTYGNCLEEVILEECRTNFDFLQHVIHTATRVTLRNIEPLHALAWEFLNPQMQQLSLDASVNSRFQYAPKFPPILRCEYVSPETAQILRQRLGDVCELYLSRLIPSEWSLTFSQAVATNVSLRVLCIREGFVYYDQLISENRGIVKFEGHDLPHKLKMAALRNLRNQRYVRSISMMIMRSHRIPQRDIRRIIAQLVFATRFCPEWDNSFSEAKKLKV